MQRHKTPRKACDLCYKKRIRCDGKKPRCTHCEVYEVQCTHTAASRGAMSKKQESPPKLDEAAQSRLDQLEARVGYLSHKLEKLEGNTPQQSLMPRTTPITDLGLSADTSSSSSMELPPLEEILPSIERYLATCNSILPLFHPKALLHTVKNWYWHPHQREPTTWAAINVALALAHRQSDPEGIIPNKSIAEYLHNAQSVLTQVIMSDTDLLNIQVLVGLVMLFQGTRDLRPPTILIATALRLAHRLQIHTRRGSELLDRAEALQRDRVFWLAYILDKDISMRIKQPPVQIDAEIDVDLPPLEPVDEDNTGFVFSAGGRSKMNFFRARITLASIQGNVYDLLYSSRSQNLSVEERSQSVARIHQMLDQWKSHIPDEFNALIIAESSPTRLSSFFCILYSTRLSCLTLINQAHSWDKSWMRGLQDYGRKTANGELTAPIPLPLEWQTLVTEARGLMRLFMSVTKKDASFIWMTTCAYISALICVMANSMCNPHHSLTQSDRELVDIALEFLDEMVQQINEDDIRSTRDQCRELNRYLVTVTQNERYTDAFLFSNFDGKRAMSPLLVGNTDIGVIQAVEEPFVLQFGNNITSTDFGTMFSAQEVPPYLSLGPDLNFGSNR
ncbi:hypothetical protein G7046_g3965 [Stylonectria norvegica]|nr:hypothetical protein G7046_g3965 [Stylonectria norvegica]